MRNRIILGLAASMVSAALGAATVVSDSAAAPALVRDSVERVNDSPLVKAAKRSLAARTKGASPVTINDQYLKNTRGGHYAEASGSPASMASGTSAPGASAFVAAPTVAPKNPRPALERQQKDLQQAARAYAYEAEQGPYGEFSEEDVNIGSQEMNQMQQQQTRQQLDSLPRPSRPPQSPRGIRVFITGVLGCSTPSWRNIVAARSSKAERDPK